MSEPSPEPPRQQPQQPPVARLRRRRFSFVWLIPLLAAGIAVYLGWRTYIEQGPELTLSLKSADGLTSGQTQVKYKAVALGTVEGIDLSRDNSHVIVHVQMNSVGRRFLTDHARFWVEGAHISLVDPSSIGSFVSGAFIAVDPGPPGGRYQTHFVGLDGPPGVRSDEPGRTYTLYAPRIGSLRTGSPVMFRDVVVGEVLGYDIGNGISPVRISIFVRAPFDDFVRPESHFWDTSGVSLDVQPGQFHLEFESIQAILAGAVTFDFPPQAVHDAPSPSGASFQLFDTKQEAESSGYEQLIPAVAYFRSSVAGLQRGAAVQVYGIQVGVVTGVSLVVDQQTGDGRVRVSMMLQPQRAERRDGFETPSKVAVLLQKLVDRGMRAEVESANLVTGQKVISLTMVPHAGHARLGREGDAYVIPSKANDMDSIMASVSDIAGKLDQLPFKEIGANVNALLKTANGTLGGPQTKQAIASLAASLKSLNATLTMLNAQYGDDSDFQHSLGQLMQQASDTLASLQELSNYLNRHPASLLLGRSAHP